MNRKYLGWFWNLFLPVSMLVIGLLAAYHIVIGEMLDGKPPKWALLVGFISIFSFSSIMHMIIDSDKRARQVIQE